MSDAGKLGTVLKDMVRVLGKEKQVLIKNDAMALVDIVEKKDDLIRKIEDFRDMEFSGDEEIRKLVSIIDNLQETNMLLTRQAIGYHDAILKALSKNNTSKYNTYSSKGQMGSQKEVSIVDQTV